MLAFNGLAAADLIIIPASAERMAVDGVADLIAHVQRIMWNKYALSHRSYASCLPCIAQRQPTRQ
jgi:cellulose biosynthesis protein BcsQ